MDPNGDPGPPPRPKIPKDGPGPRGAPECYYTSRVLNSTFRYTHYIKKLRLLEDEMRRAGQTQAKELKDKQTLEFFMRGEQRTHIRNVSHRVDLCMAAYEEDLEDKRKRLLYLLTVEEEDNMRKFVKESQAATEASWQDKKDRLAYLLAKRKKEQEARYNATPLSKSPHAYRCTLKQRSKEAQEIQLYQIREKQMRKMADAEIEKMWHEVSLKESEALAARMEMDELERQRRNAECELVRDHQREQKRLQREQDRELLKQEALQMKAMIENYKTIDAEENRKHEENYREMGRMKRETMKERQEIAVKQQAEADLIQATWNSLANQNLNQDKAKEERRKQMERDVDVCNEKLAQMKDRIATIKDNNEPLILAEGQRIQDVADLKRCLYRKKCKQDEKDNAAAILKQAAEKKLAQDEEEKEAAKLEYRRSVDRQLDELVKHKELTEGQARKLYQKDLLDQIAYNDLIKKRARQEQIDQIKKCQIATREYEDQIRNMVSRPYFSDQVHPFMKQMASGLKIVKKCKCSHPDYCADPSPPPAPSKKGN